MFIRFNQICPVVLDLKCVTTDTFALPSKCLTTDTVQSTQKKARKRSITVQDT